MRDYLRSLAFLLLTFGLATIAFGQQADQPAKQPEGTPAPAKAGAAAKQAAKPQDKKPKKVWTNDDIPSAPDPDAPKADFFSPDTPHPETTVGPIGKKDLIANFRKQLATLRAQLGATEKKISDLQNFKGNNSAPSGGIDPHHGYTMTPISDQIHQLEEKKKLIQANIEDLEDQARKQGIEPGQLR